MTSNKSEFVISYVKDDIKIGYIKKSGKTETLGIVNKDKFVKILTPEQQTKFYNGGRYYSLYFGVVINLINSENKSWLLQINVLYYSLRS